MTTPRCHGERRRELVRTTTGPDGTPLSNGIDFVEVDPSHAILRVHLIHPLPGRPGGVPAAPPLRAADVRVEGGVRITGIRVVRVAASADRVLDVELDGPGDLSPYRVRLVGPPPGFDDRLAEAEFSFAADCPSDFDCRPAPPRPAPAPPGPPLDYLTKDFATFRRLMLDRLATLLPDWDERNPADQWITLVEVLAYAADELSYYQDAVATEAHLGTALRRTSLRRHARLVDYAVHDGANARAWVCLEVADDLRGTAQDPILPAGTPVLSRSVRSGVAVRPDAYAAALAESPTVFETLHPVPALLVRRNGIALHTWGERDCVLPAGTTSASLVGSAAELALQAGDVLVLEEIEGPGAGDPANPDRRHPVRLDRAPVERRDRLTGVTVLEVWWPERDALPFPLRIDRPGPDGARAVTVARANVVLADHGRTVAESLRLPDHGPRAPRRVTLGGRHVTQAAPYDHRRAAEEPAAAATAVDPVAVLPAVTLSDPESGDAGADWRVRRDLLASDRNAAEFVVETEDDGRAHLRFGDGTFGRRPAGEAVQARYRVGSGPAGNVGAEALGRVVTAAVGITAVRNPLPAGGGRPPESAEQVRRRAPQAFRVQERAVTVADFAAAAQRHPDVQRAAATRRWTGSWHTVFVTVDRFGGRPVDAEFEAGLRAFLERFRPAGVDLEIDGPRLVPLDIALTVVVAPGHLRPDVRRALLDTFAAADLPDGRRGFFHPDNLTFGQPVYLSQVVAAAAAVPGVQRVDLGDDRAVRAAPLTRFRRWGEPSRGELAAGRITLGRLEIAQLDNDVNAPENGRLEFLMRGGR